MLFNTQPKFCSDFRIGATPKKLHREFGKLSIGTHKRETRELGLSVLVRGGTERDKNHSVISIIYVKRVRVKQLEKKELIWWASENQKKSSGGSSVVFK